MEKSVAILGSTGSIGRRALDVLRALGANWHVVALTAGGNWKELARQAREFQPQMVALADEQGYLPLKDSLKNLPINVLCGGEGIVSAATWPGADVVLCAIVGAASIEGALAALGAGKNLALASKEAMVVAGQQVLAAAKKSGAAIIPVDSEHSAIFQALQAGSGHDVCDITLTASGGPFLHWPVDKVKNATLEQALNHPTWSMGKKITIDSATMMNKALEIIEAHYLFGVRPEQIKVVIHPESIVHSLVEFCDGVVMAAMSLPDMALPIQYALTWPGRVAGIAARLNLNEIGALTFLEPDRVKFPAIDLGYAAAAQAGSAPAVLNAANEQAVDCFLRGRISFGQIVELTQEVLARHSHQASPTLPELARIDRWARDEVFRCLNH